MGTTVLSSLPAGMYVNELKNVAKDSTTNDDNHSCGKAGNQSQARHQLQFTDDFCGVGTTHINGGSNCIQAMKSVMPDVLQCNSTCAHPSQIPLQMDSMKGKRRHTRGEIPHKTRQSGKTILITQ